MRRATTTACLIGFVLALACIPGLGEGGAHPSLPDLLPYLSLRRQDVAASRTPSAFRVVRCYDGRLEEVGVFGRSWRCWPFDVSLSQEQTDELNILVIDHVLQAQEFFIEIEPGLFAAEEPANTGIVSVVRTDEGFERRDARTGTMVFDERGSLIRLANTRNTGFAMTRDAQGYPTGVASIDRQGTSSAAMPIQCAAEGTRITQVSLAADQKWRYDYDADAMLTKATAPSGFEERYTYTAGRLVETADSSGAQTRYEYDDLGRLTVIERNGRREVREYSGLESGEEGWQVVMTDAIGRKTKYMCIESKRQEVFHTPDGDTTLRQYDEDWQLVHLSSLKNGVTTICRDATGRPVSVRDGTGQITSLRYDTGLGLPSAIVSPGQGIRTLRYNIHGQVAAAMLGDGSTLSVSYDNLGRPILASNSRRGTTRLRYDDDTGLTEILDDELGTFFLGSTEGTHDLASALRQPALAHLPVLRERDLLAQELEEAELLGTDRAKRTRCVLTRSGEHWECRLDVFGNLVKIAEGDKPVASFEYDAADRLTAVEYAGDIREEFGYDLADHVVSYRDGAGNIYRYDFDFRGDLIRETLPDDTRHFYAYDAAGQLLSATNGLWTDMFLYDELGRLVAVGQQCEGEDEPETVAAYTYDAESRIVEMKADQEHVLCTYSYMDDSDLEILEVAGARFGIHYNDSGLCDFIMLPNALRLEYGYNDDGKLMRVYVGREGQPPLLSQYAMYANGRLAKVVTHHDGKAYEPAPEVEKEGAAVEALSQGEFALDAFHRVRTRSGPESSSEYAFGIGGVVRIKVNDDIYYVVRSSDKAVRALVKDGRTFVMVQSCHAGEAFLLAIEEGRLAKTRWEDTTLPILAFVEDVS